MKITEMDLIYNNSCQDFKECTKCPFNKNTLACNLLLCSGETRTVKTVVDMITQSYKNIEKLILRKENKK